MRIPRRRDCGELLGFDEIRRRLHLGMPQLQGEETIPTDHIVGTVGRAADFDRCFQPRSPRLARRIGEIRRARPGGMDAPIDVIRVDRAYFVSDGHKRVSIAREAGQEYIDARVSSAPTRYEVLPSVTSAEIDLTAQEERFRGETGLARAVPAARFAVSETEGYPELREALESYGFELIQRLGRVASREEVAAMWYECVYVPTVHAAEQARMTELLRCATEADLFLALHQQSRRLWGTECPVGAENLDDLVSKVRELPIPDQSLIDRLVRRARSRRAPELLPQRAD